MTDNYWWQPALTERIQGSVFKAGPGFVPRVRSAGGENGKYVSFMSIVPLPPFPCVCVCVCVHTCVCGLYVYFSPPGYTGVISLLSVVPDAGKVASLPHVMVWTPSLSTRKYSSATHSLGAGNENTSQSLGSLKSMVGAVLSQVGLLIADGSLVRQL